MLPFNLGALIDRNADGDRPLLIDCDNWDAPRTWTGNALEDEADGLARGLVATGLAPGDRVAILAANRAEYLAAYYATMRAGLVSVPVNTKLPTETITYVLEDSGAKLAFVDHAGRDRVGALETVVFGSAEYQALKDPGPFEPVRPSDDAVAMFLYTSGSTGKPKGVPLTHRGHLWVIEKRFQPGVDYRAQRMLVAAPLYHMNGLAMCKFAAVAGATIVLLPQFTPERYIGAIERFSCTWITSVPTMLALVTQRPELLANTDVSSVESVRMGSAPVTAELLRRVAEAFPDAKTQIGYGTTEAGPVAFGPHPEGLPLPPLALGFPHPEVRVRLTRDGQHDVDEGVLEMDCPVLTPGYHNLPEKTAGVMSEDGFYFTGDVMRRDENGFYFFVGRDDDMFVCNGENVFPEEVERLLESHESVAQACVVPVADEVRGHMPVAFVVPAEEQTPDQDTLKAYTIEHGPAYQHPRFIFTRTELPLAGTNKVDRQQLIRDAVADLRDRRTG